MRPAHGSMASSLNLIKASAFAACAVVLFTLAYGFAPLGFLIVFFPYCVLKLARLGTNRRAFYMGLATGVICYAIQLSFFWRIFGPAAISLWIILAFWMGLFVLLARLCLTNFKPGWAVVFIPFLWTGLEYFRSEIYYLRFSWVNIGYALSHHVSMTPIAHLGVYGTGFLTVGVAGAANFLRGRQRVIVCLLGLAAWVGCSDIGGWDRRAESNHVQVAGVQMEFPSHAEILRNLNNLAKRFPHAQLFVLSEYTLDGTAPDNLKAWCHDNQKYLVVGGKEPAPGSNFYNTAFVIAPSGQIVFRQGKSMPIQFFKDGLPAPEQKLWNSPWGNIGICICYDLSYSRVTDRLIRLGAQAFIVPTMDVKRWGRHQHELHRRIAPVRAAEYGVPIFRLASSGISQLVDHHGCEVVTAPFPGDGATITGELHFRQSGRRPLDRVLAPISIAVTATLMGWFALGKKWRATIRPVSFLKKNSEDEVPHA